MKKKYSLILFLIFFIFLIQYFDKQDHFLWLQIVILIVIFIMTILHFIFYNYSTKQFNRISG